MVWHIEAFETKSNKLPVYDFVDTLNQSTQIKVTRLLDYLEACGPLARMPHAKLLQHNLYELRIKGRQEVRIFYCFDQHIVYLLHGFMKKTNQTPDREIDLAQKRKNELEIV